MNAIVISCGTELVTGQCVDTNSAWLSTRLTAVGVHVVGHVTVGDDAARLSAAIRRALDEAELVIITGGLGPTPDDLTREAIAEAIHEPLQENAEALSQIRGFFERWQRPMPESNRRQAMTPRGCEVIANSRGTAPGILYRKDHRRLYALPGVPAELKAMFDSALAPMLDELSGGSRIESARLPCFGISEARLGDVLADLMRPGRNPAVGTTASQAILSIRVLAHGSSQAEARRLLDNDVAEIRRRVGEPIFGEGEDTLEGVVGALLRARGETISVAESCTGGLLAKRLTDIPGSSDYFLQGYITYSNASKMDLLGVPQALLTEHGAVSEAVARAMAAGCRERAGTDYAIAITGIAGPTGGSPPSHPVGLVYIALAHSGGVEVVRHLLGEHLTRDEVRDRACKVALNMLRLQLVARSGGPP